MVKFANAQPLDLYVGAGNKVENETVVDYVKQV